VRPLLHSAPTLSLRELFRRRHRFVGALTVPTATPATRANAPTRGSTPSRSPREESGTRCVPYT
jgi:hypothetical protein